MWYGYTHDEQRKGTDHLWGKKVTYFLIKSRIEYFVLNFRRELLKTVHLGQKLDLKLGKKVLMVELCNFMWRKF